MDMNCLAVILAQGTAPSAAGPAGAPVWMQPVFMLLVIVLFYFILIRPQQLKVKQQAKLLKGLKSGDRVNTSSGILGVVISVKDNTVTLRSGDSKLEMTKGSITEILSSEVASAS
jgi:preprotein translocase subunit YajC